MKYIIEIELSEIEKYNLANYLYNTYNGKFKIMQGGENDANKNNYFQR